MRSELKTLQEDNQEMLKDSRINCNYVSQYMTPSSWKCYTPPNQCRPRSVRSLIRLMHLTANNDSTASATQ